MNSENESKQAASALFSERFKRSLVNQMAHRLAQEHFRKAREILNGQLDAAEMRGRDAQLLKEWREQLQLQPEAGEYSKRRADV